MILRRLEPPRSALRCTITDSRRRHGELLFSSRAQGLGAERTSRLHESVGRYCATTAPLPTTLRGLLMPGCNRSADFGEQENLYDSQSEGGLARHRT